MAEIINEIPDELKDDDESQEIELKEDKEDYEAAAEAKVEESKKETKQEELDFEIEEEDDTPPQDRNREPLPDKIKQELDDDTLDDYSDRVKQRMSQLKKAWHDERRAKEALDREREEAVKYAQNIINENKKLKQTLSVGEEDYLKTLKEKYESDLLVAKRDYREAYDAGDGDKIIEAQAKLNEAQFKLSKVNDMRPQYSLQNEENSVSSEQAKIFQPRAATPDTKAQAWQEKNQWFGKDEEMTSLALGLHEKLVRSGINPTSDIYYRRIDETMQKRFPEYFGDDTESIEEKPQRKPSTVVAPATRSTGPKKIRLTKTQLALAKKFKLTPEQYARELIKTENANG